MNSNHVARETNPSNGSGRPQREKVLFPVNEPVILMLDYDQGELSPGKWGDQFMWGFDGHTRVAWMDPDVDALIRKSGAKAGDSVAICKREIRSGSRKRVQWEVERIDDETGMPAGEPHQDDLIAEKEEAARRARRDAERPAPEPAPAPAPVKASNGQDTRAAGIAVAAQQFSDHIIAAVLACQDSTKRADQLGFSLPWTAADVRAIATTMYIQSAGKGGRQ
ncbi:MAG TPA: hypothetical protein VKU01_23970 [Bryobacteraceae bacterium]|nr:hypothetical protein [Bryobacteraceae bacterium]